MSSSARGLAFAFSAGLVLLLAICAALRGPLDSLLLFAVGGALGVGWLISRAQPAIVERPVAKVAKQRHSIAEALLATIPDPVILVDRRAVVIEANPAARELLPGLKLRHPLSFVLRAPDVLGGIEEVVRTGLPLKTTFAPRVTTERLFEVQIGALKTPDAPEDAPPNIVLFLRDLTTSRRLETMRVDFVANASHELRTPLASLIGFIETLQGPAREDPVAREKFLAIMATQARRMARLVDDLLSLSRIELREHVAPTQVLDLAEIARTMVEAQAPLAAERGVSVGLDAPETAYPILGERDELLRVIENLIENAVKYGGSGGLVDVVLRRLEPGEGRGPRIELAVRDEGPGIAAEHIPRLTERFYRVDTASSRQQGGTGLGLAIVKHTLNRHRGRIAIESELGQGTTVRVTLPEHRVVGAAKPPDPRFAV